MSNEPRPLVRMRQPRPSGVGMDRGRRLSAADPERGPRIPTLGYRLVVLTNGRPCVRETLEAFRALATPQPREVLIVDDGGSFVAPYGGGNEWHAIPVLTTRLRPARGFCGAVEATWQLASTLELTDAGPLEWVFWLEDDILLSRPLDLRPLAATMLANERLTQMALMRQPVNELEIAAGGCRALRPELYEERDEGAWLESRTNHSTGCSLIARDFMVEHPWPAYPENCEGRFSIDLLAAGYTFGVWGAGEPWVEHIGVRSGHGY